MMTLRVLFLLTVAFTPIAKYRHEGPAFLPDPKVTPGAVRTTDAKEICAATFRTKTIRKTPQRAKKEAFAAYGIPWSQRKDYEADHLLALEDGGADPTCIKGKPCDIRNLWPQPAEPRPGFHEKDKLENEEHRLVCSGELTLKEAQHELAEDWFAAYQKRISKAH